MTQSQTITLIEGVNVSEHGVVKLTKDLFANIDLQKYPQNCLHMLVYAIQHQLKIPTLKSMERTHKRNTGGLGKPKAAKKPKGSRKRAPVQPKLLIKRQSSSSSSNSLSSAPSKSLISTFKLKSSEQIVLKAQRQKCVQELKQLIAQKKNQLEKKSSNKREFPAYFKKKHQSHKRRHKQRWGLIKANRSRLIQLFGYDILKPESRIGIKDIKIALNMQEKEIQIQNVRQFMEMVDQNEQDANLKQRSQHE